MFGITSLKISSLPFLTKLTVNDLYSFLQIFAPLILSLANQNVALSFFNQGKLFFWDKFVLITQAHLTWCIIISLYTIWDVLLLIKY